MTKITYTVGKQTGTIHWVASEHFKELENTTFKLGELEAVKIESRNNLSLTAKILLSAVAGAVIQHLLDKGVETELLFASGFFVIETTDN